MLKVFRRRVAVQASRGRSFRAVAHVVAARQGERTILLDARRGRYFGVDRVGASIWGLLSEGATLPQLVDGLEREYGASREMLTRDVAAFLARLQRARLVMP